MQVRHMPSCGVCVTRSYILSKRIKISSNFFSPSGIHTMLVFLQTKRDDDIPTGTPLIGASNAGGVGRNRDSEPISGLQQATCCQQGRRWTTACTVPSLVVYCGVFDYQTPRVIISHRRRGSTARDRPSALSHYTQSRSTANGVYDSKAERYAEDNRTESNCSHR